MIVFVGERPSKSVRAFARTHGWGQMFIYEDPVKYASEVWAFDNGAYTDWVSGREFNRYRYLKALERAQKHRYAPYMAIVPDLVGRGRESLDFSMKWLSELPKGWPWYLALQDGMTNMDVEGVIEHFQGLFLGGTDRFKQEADFWRDFADYYAKDFHYARAGTERKIKHALRIKADSLDSSFPLWTVQRMRRMEYLVNEWEQKEPRLYSHEEALGFPQ